MVMQAYATDVLQNLAEHVLQVMAHKQGTTVGMRRMA